MPSAEALNLFLKQIRSICIELPIKLCHLVQQLLGFHRDLFPMRPPHNHVASDVEDLSPPKPCNDPQKLDHMLSESKMQK